MNLLSIFYIKIQSPFCYATQFSDSWVAKVLWWFARIGLDDRHKPHKKWNWKLASKIYTIFVEAEQNHEADKIRKYYANFIDTLRQPNEDTSTIHPTFIENSTKTEDDIIDDDYNYFPSSLRD